MMYMHSVCAILVSNIYTNITFVGLVSKTSKCHKKLILGAIYQKKLKPIKKLKKIYKTDLDVLLAKPTMLYYINNINI